MIRLSPRIDKGWIIGGLALTATAVLAFHYFSIQETGAPVSSQWAMFYPKLDPKWLRVSISDFQTAMDSGKTDLWHEMILRTALSRWRLRRVSPRPFDRLMNYYSKGLWLAPSRDEWMAFLKKIDNRWTTQRRKLLPRDESFIRISTTERDKRIYLRFMDRPLTVQVGSMIRLVWDAENGQLPTTPLTLEWTSFRDNTNLGNHIRKALWTPLDDGPPGKQRFVMEVDLSWEPDWLAPDVRALQLSMLLPHPGAWKLVKIETVDSPWLPIDDAPSTSSP